jgi:hypothetical protein
LQAKDAVELHAAAQDYLEACPDDLGLTVAEVADRMRAAYGGGATPAYAFDAADTAREFPHSSGALSRLALLPAAS